MYEIITQNVNELYTPIKKQLDGWKNKTKIPRYMLPLGDLLTSALKSSEFVKSSLGLIFLFPF